MKLFKEKKDIENLRKSGKILAEVLVILKSKVIPGFSAKELDLVAKEEIKKRGAIPSFLNYTPKGSKRPFPGVLCVSVNDEIVHGIPNELQKIFKEGDIVSIDCGLSFNGIYTDSAITVPCGEVDSIAKDIILATQKALMEGIKVSKPGKKTGDIGHAIFSYTKKTKFSIADDFGGHGVGFKIHDDPFIPNFSAPDEGVVLEEGMALAIEPMLNEGGPEISFSNDGYTVLTKDGKRSAHFEHTILITKKGPEIITII